MNALWPHQESALGALSEKLGSGASRLMVQMPTGAGKTKLASVVIKNELEAGRRAIFVVPAKELINQTAAMFRAEGLGPIGIIQADHPGFDPEAPLQVATVQTLTRRMLPRADLVIIDEAHKWFDFYETWFEDPAWRDIPFIGLTATPWTRGLGKHYKDFIIGATTLDLIQSTYLCDFKVFAPSHPDLTAVKLVAGEYHEGQLSDAMNKSPLVADLVQTWMEKGEDRPTLCFCVDRAHAKAVQLKFMAAGISCGYIDCFSGRAEREEVRLAFASGDLRVVCNVGVLTTGVDWDVRCIILARPTRSRILFTQIIGRGLRRAEGKDHCLVLDHSDNHLRLGFVTDPIPQELDDGEGPRRDERQHGEPLPSECASCHFLRPPKVHKCPACGFEPKPVSTIKCDDGELVEIKRLERERIDETERAQWHGALARIASLRGYKPGWAAHKFKEKFGHFPACRYPEECAPTQEIYNWVRSRQIAWAKSRPPDG